MANLQATKITGSLEVQTNTYIKLGTAYISNGGNLAHFGQNAYYIAGGGGGWLGGGGPVLQLSNAPSFTFYSNTTSYPAPLDISEITSSLGSTTHLFLKTNVANSTQNSTVGVGARAGTAATDGKVLINAGGTGKPALEFTNCAGNSNASSTTYNVFKGWLAVKIGANVGASAASTGTHYIRLWGT